MYCFVKAATVCTCGFVSETPKGRARRIPPAIEMHAKDNDTSAGLISLQRYCSRLKNLGSFDAIMSLYRLYPAASKVNGQGQGW